MLELYRWVHPFVPHLVYILNPMKWSTTDGVFSLIPGVAIQYQQI